MVYKCIFDFLGQYSHPFDNDIIFVGIEMTFHEGDHGKIPPKHVMENVDWLHEWSRWVCTFDACINNNTTKWLFH
jgi:hypothetical protein